MICESLKSNSTLTSVNLSTQFFLFVSFCIIHIHIKTTALGIKEWDWYVNHSNQIQHSHQLDCHGCLILFSISFSMFILFNLILSTSIEEQGCKYLSDMLKSNSTLTFLDLSFSFPSFHSFLFIFVLIALMKMDIVKYQKHLR